LKTLNHANLQPFISSPRLNTYQGFFAPKNNTELLGCYLWNQEVAAAFFPLLQALEISLRNAVHKEAKAALGAYWFDRLATKPLAAANAFQRRAHGIHTSNLSNARNDIQQRLSSSAITEDRIVSTVTFGFWTNLFNPVFDVNRNPKALWPQLLRPVFPNAPKGYRDRHIIEGKLVAIKTFRNKAFHHEPVWNIGRPINQRDALLKLHNIKDIILDIIKWISQDCLDMVEKAGYVDSVIRICSDEHLRYLQYPGSNERTFTRTKRELRNIISLERTTTDVIQNGKKIAKIIGC